MVEDQPEAVEQRLVLEEADHRPVHAGGDAGLPRPLPGDSFLINDGKTRLSLQDAANGIRGIYNDLLTRAWDEARARGNKLPATTQMAIPPTVPGQQ